jgi:3-phenylpropionate/trans-cinnamate dioxygenase ferredoxin reductase subunit
MTGHVVVVGSGHAGVELADALRSGGYDGSVTLVGDDPALPYQRPPLSKDFLEPGPEPTPLPLRSEGYYTERGIALRRGVEVTSVHTASRRVTLSDGAELPWSHLVLATGAASRPLPVPGRHLAGIHTLRTLADAHQLHRALGDVESVVVVGGGFIGLEFAAAAVKWQVAVTVLEAAALPMGRVLSPAMSRHFVSAHGDLGTAIRLGEGLAAFEGAGGRVQRVVSTSGTRYPADLVLVGAGVLPRTELAVAAGLAVRDGVEVDARLRTNAPEVYAVGDCANFPGSRPGERHRLESVQNAVGQARHVAGEILGSEAEYHEIPWFWSKQGHLRLQIAGLGATADECVVRGEPEVHKLSAFCFTADELVAVESLNRPAFHNAARRLLGSDRAVTRAALEAADYDLPAMAREIVRALPVSAAEPVRPPRSVPAAR